MDTTQYTMTVMMLLLQLFPIRCIVLMYLRVHDDGIYRYNDNGLPGKMISPGDYIRSKISLCYSRYIVRASASDASFSVQLSNHNKLSRSDKYTRITLYLYFSLFCSPFFCFVSLVFGRSSAHSNKHEIFPRLVCFVR